MMKKAKEGSVVPDSGEASFLSLLSVFLAQVAPRTREIVGERFGLSGSRAKTLEEIGREYGITRERVRQILQSAYSFVKQRRDEPAFIDAANRIETALRDRSGIMRADELLSTLSRGKARERGALSFFLECMKQVTEERETADRVRVFTLSPDFSEEKWKKVVKAATTALETAGRTLSRDELWNVVKKQVSVEEKEFFHYLAASSRIGQNPFGFFGFADSTEINPRGTREKAYLILKMAGSPLHFKEIASRIDGSGLQKKGKPTHPQTVHNELIKDKKFVLVGRGLYALSEWGYSRGTVREVLDSILRKAGKPMKREDILQEVLKARSVKRSTVVINLNTFFEKIGKDSYTVK